MQYLLVGLATWAVAGISSIYTSTLHRGTLDMQLNGYVPQSSRHPHNPYNERFVMRPSFEFDQNSGFNDANEVIKPERTAMGNDDGFITYNRNGIKFPAEVRERKRRDTWVERMHKDIRNRSEEAYKAGMDAVNKMREIARSKRDLNSSDKSNVTEATHKSQISSLENKNNQTNYSGNVSDATIALVYGIRNKTNNSTTAKIGQEDSRQMGPKENAFNNRDDLLKVEGGVIKIAGKELELGKKGENDKSSDTERENNDDSSTDPKRNQHKDRGSLQKGMGGTLERNNNPGREDGMGPRGKEGNRRGTGPRDGEDNRRVESNRRQRISQTNRGNVEDSRQ